MSETFYCESCGQHVEHLIHIYCPDCHVKHLAYSYGRSVALRENYAHGNQTDFDAYNDSCMRLWKELIYNSAYADEEHSKLKPEYAEHYYAGIHSIPDTRY